jgi:archaetidylinositol phosphate synthase
MVLPQMLSKIQYLVEGHFQEVAGVFKKAGFSPNSVTVTGFLLSVIASFFYASGLGSLLLVTGAFFSLLVGAYLDAVDGAMARRYNLVSKIGGIFDSVLDRIAEIALYTGLLFGGLVPGWLALWAVSASLMVSYVRARVDVEGVKLKGVGLAERPERLLILLIATILAAFDSVSLEIGVGLVAALSTITVVERLYRTELVLGENSVAV